MRTRKASLYIRRQPTAGDQPDGMRRVLERLVQALVGLAERQLPGDPLPCFCVRHDRFEASKDAADELAADDPHDEWCENARIALKEAGELTVNSRPA